MDDGEFLDLAAAGLKNHRVRKTPLFMNDDYHVLAFVVGDSQNPDVKHFLVVCRTITYPKLTVSCDCVWAGYAPRVIDSCYTEARSDGFVCRFTSALRSRWGAVSISGACVSLEKTLVRGSARVVVRWSLSGASTEGGFTEVQIF